MRQDLIHLLDRIVGNEPLTDVIRLRALDVFADVLKQPESAGQVDRFSSQVAGSQATPGATSARRLVYVHGICRHVPGFSDPWWASLRPFVANTFGVGLLGQNRLEVVWSDLVNEASSRLATALTGGAPGTAVAAQQAKQQAAAEIKEALRDRADHAQMNAAIHSPGASAGASPVDLAVGGISIPGLNCIDDFSIYLTSNAVRQQILDRFLAVVRPLFQAGNPVDLVSHSWGTVVAYEGLRQLEDEGHTATIVRNLFTVGSALSIGPVKSRLRDANKDGRKPQSVRRWVNLDAQGDIVGGPLKGRPYAVDSEFLNLAPTGCGSFLGIVNPQCAHGSYFVPDNVVVNRDIFGTQMLTP